MSIAPKQLVLFSFPKSKTAHGGSLGHGKRKTGRPLCAKRSTHIVMRATSARGPLSLLQTKNAKAVLRLMKKYSKQFEVRVYEYANVSNHLHLLVRAKTKEGMRNFLRAYAGHLAQVVTGSGPGRPLKKRFWDLLVFTRLIEWGAFQIAMNYIWKNILQGAAIRRYSPLKRE